MPRRWVAGGGTLRLPARSTGGDSSPNRPAKQLHSLDDPKKSRQQSDAEEPMREETLGDRIGDRMWSRLAEMCIEMNLVGRDLRQSMKKARLG
ncbi:MAG: hypothetical protein JOZ83_02955 [Silvibacterium sp.]|nr:hypothetical protein [Silvibacterium sp.]